MILDDTMRFSGPGLLPGPARRLTWDEHDAKWGPVRGDVANVVEGAALAGRGGAHFPTIVKLKSAAKSPGGTFVVNASEGEPGSRKDYAIATYDPHLILDGAFAAAELISAARVVVFTHTPQLWDVAAERMKENGVSLLRAEGGYTAGEASAVIAAVSGKAGKPTYVTDKAKPWGAGPAVLVQNAETCARIGVAAHGYHPSDTACVSVARGYGVSYDDVLVREVSLGTQVGELLTDTPYAVLIGGVCGTWFTWPQVAGKTLGELDRGLGAGIVHPVYRKDEGVGQVNAMLAYLAGSSAKQCGPCTFGTQAMADASSWAERIEVGALITGRGACALPDGAARMAETAAQVFS